MDVYNDYDPKNYNHKFVIYAPHHSFDKGGLNYATFLWSGKYILEWAQKHSEIDWLFKPHPRFKTALLVNKIMTIEEIDRYYSAWDKIGKVYDDGNYFEFFKNSKCLISDCSSFLTEYLPTEQPVIHMRNKNAIPYSVLNNKIIKAYYSVWNIKELEKTLENILIENNDPRKIARQKLIEKLNLKNINASDNILDFLYKVLEIKI